MILYGSRARGTATSKSDYDIIGLQASGEATTHQEFFKDTYLDISLYPPKEDDESDSPSFSFWQEAVILHQPHDEGEQFVNAVKKEFYQNKKDLSQEKILKIRMLTINFDRAQKDETREHFYRHRFLKLALVVYFPIRNLTYMGPRKSFEWLQENDPLTYASFKKAFAPSANAEDFLALLKQVAGPDLDIKYQTKENLGNDSDDSQIKKYISSQDPLLPEIVRHIQKTYGAHTIILYGSRAQGTATSKSDYDILALRGPGIPEETKKDLFGDVYLDIHFFPEEALNDMYLVSPLSLVKGADILCQKDHLGEDFIHHLKKIYNQGFVASTQFKQKVVDEIKMNQWKIDHSLVGFFYQHSLLPNLLEHYFTLRNLYYIGTRESFAWLQENDLPTYYAFEKALKPDASIESINELVDHVIAPFENKEREESKLSRQGHQIL